MYVQLRERFPNNVGDFILRPYGKFLEDPFKGPLQDNEKTGLPALLQEQGK